MPANFYVWFQLAVEACVVYKNDCRVGGNGDAAGYCLGSIHNVNTVYDHMPVAGNVVGHRFTCGVGNDKCLTACMVIKRNSNSAFTVGGVGDHGGVQRSKDCVLLSYANQLLVVAHHFVFVATFLENRPIDVVDGVAGLIAVLVTVLGAQHFLTCLEEHGALGDHQKGCAKAVHGKAFLNGVISVGEDELIPQSVVIMCTHIVNDHTVFHFPAKAGAGAALDTKEHRGEGAVAVAADIALGGCGKYAALKTVANDIVEYGNAADSALEGLDLADLALVSQGRRKRSGW